MLKIFKKIKDQITINAPSLSPLAIRISTEDTKNKSQHLLILEDKNDWSLLSWTLMARGSGTVVKNIH
jgi:hypothetical protein